MKNYKICIIGLGNVGLDLAINFSKKYYTVGFDNNIELIEKLIAQKKKYLKYVKNSSIGLRVSSDIKNILKCDVYIVTVPTPINNKKSPLLKNILDVTKLVSKIINKDNIVIYESTFYPGLTEDICIPIIEKYSKLKLNKDFFVGYSPERINIGENKKMSNEIVKITSGSNKKASDLIDNLYKSVIDSGTYKVESIKVAEAVKIMENCQRDLNIALMNELAKFFNKIGLNSNDIIKAAATKWNFMSFYPGLVGGDCIAVDPYYILHSAKKINHKLPLISLVRKTNEDMLNYIYNEIIKKLSEHKISKIAFFGIAYKKNCDQTKNSMYLKLAISLKSVFSVDMYDYLVSVENSEVKLTEIEKFKIEKYDAIIIGAQHKKYKEMNFNSFLNKSSIVINIHSNKSKYQNSIL